MNRRRVISIAAAGALTGGAATARPSRSEDEAMAIVGRWYSLFTVQPGRDVRAVFDQVIASDFQGLTGDGPLELRDRDTTMKFIEALGHLVPDMSFSIKELLVVGDRVIVRGEASGAPAGDFLGVAHTGRRFQIMTIDILTLRDRKITKTYHLENWIAALAQLRGAA